MDLVHGLPYISIRPFTDTKWETLCHVTLTSDREWDPSIYDGSINVSNLPEDPDVLDATVANRINAYSTSTSDSTAHPIQVNFHKTRLHVIQKDLCEEYATYPHITSPTLRIHA